MNKIGGVFWQCQKGAVPKTNPPSVNMAKAGVGHEILIGRQVTPQRIKINTKREDISAEQSKETKRD